MSKTPEGITSREIQDFLKAAGVFHMRLQSGKVRVRGGMMHLCPVGTGDVIVFLPKRVGWLEVKQLKGLQREAQKEFQAKVEGLGHAYAVVRSVDDVKVFLEANKL